MNRLTDINIKTLIFICILLGFTQFGNAQKKNDKFVVVLDAGHGGHDPGARGVVENEKVITLDIVLKLGKLIKDHYKDEVKVIYTREDDRFIELYERAAIANRNNADFFISVHCNSARPSASGTETFVLGTEENRTNDNFSVVKAENSVILLEEDHEERYQGFDPKSPESVIGLTLMQNLHLENSLKFAAAVENNFTAKDKRLSRGVKQAGFLVLWRAAVPAVLIETGFISNPEEGRLLASEEGQRNTAESIFNAFKIYKNEWDYKRGRTPAAEKPKEEPKKAEPEKPVAGKIFKVQFLSSSRKFRTSAPQLKGLNPVEIVKDGKMYKYYYGSTSFASKRDEFLRKVKKAGFPDAFVVEIPTAGSTEKPTSTKTNTDTPKTMTSGYRIQILTTQKNYGPTAPQMKGLKPVDKVEEGGLFKYYYGWYATESEAREAITKVKSSGFADAFIVQFANGKKK